jgi:hypothetical protein
MITTYAVGKAYNRGYRQGLTAGLWPGFLGGIFFSILCAAIYHMAGR